MFKWCTFDDIFNDKQLYLILTKSCLIGNKIDVIEHF